MTEKVSGDIRVDVARSGSVPLNIHPEILARIEPHIDKVSALTDCQPERVKVFMNNLCKKSDELLARYRSTGSDHISLQDYQEQMLDYLNERLKKDLNTNLQFTKQAYAAFGTNPKTGQPYAIEQMWGNVELTIFRLNGAPAGQASGLFRSYIEHKNFEIVNKDSDFTKINMQELMRYANKKWDMGKKDGEMTVKDLIDTFKIKYDDPESKRLNELILEAVLDTDQNAKELLYRFKNGAIDKQLKAMIKDRIEAINTSDTKELSRIEDNIAVSIASNMYGAMAVQVDTKGWSDTPKDAPSLFNKVTNAATKKPAEYRAMMEKYFEEGLDKPDINSLGVNESTLRKVVFWLPDLFSSKKSED